MEAETLWGSVIRMVLPAIVFIVPFILKTVSILLFFCSRRLGRSLWCADQMQVTSDNPLPLQSSICSLGAVQVVIDFRVNIVCHVCLMLESYMSPHQCWQAPHFDVLLSLLNSCWACWYFNMDPIKSQRIKSHYSSTRVEGHEPVHGFNNPKTSWPFCNTRTLDSVRL